MTCTKWSPHVGRSLEAPDHHVMISPRVWIYEDDRPLRLHGTLSLRDDAAVLAAGRDVLGQAMECAIRDVEAGRFCLDASPAPLGGRVR